MSVRNRLLFGVLVLLGALALAVAVLVGLFTREISDVLGRNAQSAASAMTDEIDRNLFQQVEGLREFLALQPRLLTALQESALELESAAAESLETTAEDGTPSATTLEEAVTRLLAERDRQWIEGEPAGEERKAEILARPISVLLRDRQAFYRERYGFEMLGEIFLTDRLGANVAQTGVTSDYLQSDEAWWQQAWDEGLAVGDPRWDESAGVLAVEISLPVLDDRGHPVGVLKAVLALDEILRVVRTSLRDLGFEHAAVEVVTAGGQRVLVDGDTSLIPAPEPLGEEVPGAEGFRRLEATAERPAVLTGWSTSRGYRDYEGTGWTVRLILDSREVLAPLDQLRKSLLLVASVTLPFAIVVSFLIGRSITRPVDRAVAAADRLARGDYGFDVSGSARGELGRLLTALGSVVENGRRALRGMVLTSSRVGSAAQELTAVSSEISQGAQRQLESSQRTAHAMEAVSASTEQLAVSSEQVSGLVQDVSSSVEEMAGSNEGVAGHSQELSRALDRTSQSLRAMVTSVQDIAEGAQKARGDSEEAVAEAEAGGEAVERVIHAIGEVSETLDLGLRVMQTLDRTHGEVGQRIRLIDELCDETELLAINAAIEAANAGEHGRTFAVVAADMRRLSERSAEAAREIGEVLERVAGDVARALEVTETGAREAREGESLAKRAGTALERIAKAVTTTRSRMTTISATTEEQALASTEALGALEEIRDLSQRVEEATREQAQGSQRIAEAVTGIRDLAEEVSAASGNQSRESERVARAMGQIHTICQEQAETVVQITGVAEDLREQVAELERVAGFFQLSRDDTDTGGELGAGGEAQPPREA